MKSPSIIRNFIMNAILTASSFLFPLVTFPYISRVLLPEGTGKVSFAISLISYFSMFAQLGIPTYGIRACAKVRNDREKLSRTVHELFIINLVMSIAAYSFLILCLNTVPRLQEDKPLYAVVSLSIILTSLGMEWLYKALEQYAYITIRSLLFKAVALISTFALIHDQADYVIYGGITIFAASASNICNLVNLHKYITLKPVGNYQIKRHLKPVAVFFAMACATTIYTNLDTVMLGFMTIDQEVGYYNAAVRIKSILVSIVTSLGAVLLPRASYYVQMDQMKKFWEISRKAIHFVFLISLPLMVYFILFAKEGIYLLSGKAYTASICPMKILMPTLPLIGITNIMGIQILVPLGREKVVLYSEMGGAVINLILNGLLIPFFGASGAAAGTVAAELTVLVIQYVSLKKEINPVFKSIPYISMFSGIGLGILGSAWTKFLNLPNIMILIFSTVFFFGIYFIIMLIMKDELLWELLLNLKGKIGKGGYGLHE